MAADAPAPVATRDLDRLYRAGTLNGFSEAQLLDRFLGSRDEYAFAAIVSKHGPMVLRTCRALLGDPHAADDAFQATFLVLARRAGSIRNAELLGPWLHRVARRVAARSRAAAARRLRRERPSPEILASATARSPLPDPDRLALHEAIDRLPEAYRRVVILCDLQGHSHAEAASRLGCPIGTVKGRQSRARALLRRRLSRGGLAPVPGPIVPLPSVLDAATVPAPMLARTARAAVAFAGGGALASGAIPAGVIGISNGAIAAMFAQKLGSVLLSVGLLAVGIGAMARSPSPFGLLAAASSRPADGDHHQVPVGDLASPLIGRWERISSDGTRPQDRAPLQLEFDTADVPSPLPAHIPNDARGTILRRSSRVIGPNGQTMNGVDLALVDPSRNPGDIDVYGYRLRIGDDGQAVGPLRGIYRVEDDLLTIRMGLAPGPRPSSFDPDPGTGVLERYRRLPGGPPDVPISSSDDFHGQFDSRTRSRLASLVGSWTLVSMNGAADPPRCAASSSQPSGEGRTARTSASRAPGVARPRTSIPEGV